jgi:hypothetical protein
MTISVLTSSLLEIIKRTLRVIVQPATEPRRTADRAARRHESQRPDGWFRLLPVTGNRCRRPASRAMSRCTVQIGCLFAGDDVALVRVVHKQRHRTLQFVLFRPYRSERCRRHCRRPDLEASFGASLRRKTLPLTHHSEVLVRLASVWISHSHPSFLSGSDLLQAAARRPRDHRVHVWCGRIRHAVLPFDPGSAWPLTSMSTHQRGGISSGVRGRRPARQQRKDTPRQVPAEEARHLSVRRTGQVPSLRPAPGRGRWQLVASMSPAVFMDERRHDGAAADAVSAGESREVGVSAVSSGG